MSEFGFITCVILGRFSFSNSNFYYVSTVFLSTVLGIGDLLSRKNSYPHGAYILMGETDHNKFAKYVR